MKWRVQLESIDKELNSFRKSSSADNTSATSEQISVILSIAEKVTIQMSQSVYFHRPCGPWEPKFVDFPLNSLCSSNQTCIHPAAGQKESQKKIVHCRTEAHKHNNLIIAYQQLEEAAKLYCYLEHILGLWVAAAF